MLQPAGTSSFHIRGMDLELMLKLRKQDKESYIEEEVKPNAVKRLERSLIMKELTRKHEIKIDETALEGEIKSLYQS